MKPLKRNLYFLGTYQLIDDKGSNPKKDFQCIKKITDDKHTVALFCNNTDKCPHVNPIVDLNYNVHLTMTENPLGKLQSQAVTLQYVSNGKMVDETCGNETCKWIVDTNSTDPYQKQMMGPLNKEGRNYVPVIETTSVINVTEPNDSSRQAQEAFLKQR